MTATIANVLWLLGAAAFLASVVASVRRRPQWFPLMVVALVLLAVECALERAWAGAGWNAGWAVVLLGGDWWNRRGRKAARQLGVKSLALLAAVVERLREVAVPVPEGAGA